MPPPRPARLQLAVGAKPMAQLQLRRTLFGLSRPSPARTRARLWFAVGIIVGAGGLVYAKDSRAGFHRWLAIPLVHALTIDDPERGHELAVQLLKTPFAPVDRGTDDEVLSFELWGRRFSNPLGIAAGFDKHGEAIDGLFGLGFGYVEIGSVTPQPQPGNPKPRFFRLSDTQSVINRYGFNSDGHFAVIARLRDRIVDFVRANALLLPSAVYQAPLPEDIRYVDPIDRLLSSRHGRDAALVDAAGVPRSLRPGRVFAVNLGKNKASNPDAVDDYVNGVKRLGPYADVVVVNVSSPNTPGLRALQRRGMLEELLESVVKARDDLTGSVKPAVLVKVSPDLSRDELDDVASAALETKIDGVIVSNTTISRPASAGTSSVLTEVGGLSGPPLKPLALSALAALHVATEGTIPLVGCGGISSAADALDYARAGASFVQLYTGLAYQGPGLPRFLKDDLAATLRKEGKRWQDLVGVDAKRMAPPRPAKTTADDEATLQLKHELETVLADLAAGRTPTHPGQAPLAVRAAAGLAEEPTTMPDVVLSGSPVAGEVAAPSTFIESTLPIAAPQDAEPTSGVLPKETAASVPVVPIEQTGVPAAKGPPAEKVERPAPILAELLPATSRTERGGTGKPPLSGLFSTFGERKNASQSGKRLV